jgi:hypothetical protein
MVEEVETFLTVYVACFVYIVYTMNMRGNGGRGADHGEFLF